MAGRYRLDAVLGRGGMGSVWLAHHLTLNSPVAIKLIDPEIALESAVVERFMREAQAAAALRSPHVVQTLDYGVHGRIPYIAMELLDGESLAQRLARVRCLSPADTAKVLTHIARALGKAHDLGIVHRDLKPDNVFLVKNDDEEIAKVLDFGIAKLTHTSLEAASQTQTGALLGTPYYMSPEQAEGAKTIGPRSDMWSMGVIAFECLLGERPFRGSSIGDLVLRICAKPMPTPSAIGPVPHGFDAWFAKACARDPQQRFASARELAEAFRHLIPGFESALSQREWTAPAAVSRHPATTTNVPVISAASAPGRRVRNRVWLALAFAGVVLGAIGTFAALSSPTAHVSVAAGPATHGSALTPAQPALNPKAPGVEPVTAEPPGSAEAAADDAEDRPASVAGASRRPPRSRATIRASVPSSASQTVPSPAREPASATAPALVPERAPARPTPRPNAANQDETDFGF